MWELDTMGIEVHELDSGFVEADVYFLAPISASVKKALAGNRALQIAELRSREDFDERDWMEKFRNRAKPFRVGEGFLVYAGEPGQVVCDYDSKLHELMIPARRTFGTGAHPSTSLVVEMLERLDLSGKKILDVGTGTGILTFVAAHLGARSAVSLDIDPVACIAAHQNATLNRLPLRVFTGRVRALRQDACFDLALANVLPHDIEPDLIDLAGLVADGGEVIFSGILVEFEVSSRRLVETIGFKVVEQRDDGEWSVLRVACPNR
jgi:ribosomal protein L11 methyltransferase